MNYQKIILIGNATAAAKVEKPKGKTAYADLTVAVSRGREETDFFPVRAFAELTEVGAGIKKGAKVVVEGRVEINHYVSQDGQPFKTIRVIADALRLIYQPGSKEPKQKGRK